MTTPTLHEIAAATTADRNRAVDAYRVIAMIAVAVGHWLVLDVRTADDGELIARNALEAAPGLAWLTWLFQVMPLFFVVGGFASAMSLDAHHARGGDDRAWVAARLRRMVAPTAVLAAVWLVVLVGGVAVGVGGVVAAGAVGAAIPLWFLANYTIDTALAPTMLRAVRRRRRATVTGLIVAFVTVEVLHVAGVPVVGQVNWVVGWLLFQVAGFVWRDGGLPTGPAMAARAAALWAAAVALVALGPWPVTMIHVSGVAFSPTHPPSIALVVFGAAYSATAIAAAPAVTRFLAGHAAAWRTVVAGGAVSMSVYLWHFTAAVAASAAFAAVGALPSAAVGTTAWWFQKAPLIALAAALLVPLVGAVSGVERRGLLAGRDAGVIGRGRISGSVFVLAAAVSASLKLWSAGHAVGAVAGMLGVAACHRVLSGPARGPNVREGRGQRICERNSFVRSSWGFSKKCSGVPTSTT